MKKKKKNWVPLKLSSSAEFMINIPIQNDYSLPCPTPVHLKTGEFQRKGEIDTEQGSVGFLGTKPFCVPHFFDHRK